MNHIAQALLAFKTMLEGAIVEKGEKGKESAIRSSKLINLIHDVVKQELINLSVDRNSIYPRLGETTPEIKLAGFLKQKYQDVCVVPSNILKAPMTIDWGPLRFESKEDPYGFDFSTKTLAINVRSQMSSLEKNADTLFERTFAEAQNLHQRYPNIVLGEVYLIPTNEYDDNLVRARQVGFKETPTNIEKYINFFNAINCRGNGGADYMYERCALLIVDFKRSMPKLYRTIQEMREDGLVSSDFDVDYTSLAFDTFAQDILNIYDARHGLSNLTLPTR